MAIEFSAAATDEKTGRLRADESEDQLANEERLINERRKRFESHREAISTIATWAMTVHPSWSLGDAMLAGRLERAPSDIRDLTNALLSTPVSEYTEPPTLLSTEIERLLEQFSPKVREIVDLRLTGLGKPSETLEEIGKRLEVTRERVRQLEKQAIKTINEHMNSAEGSKIRWCATDLMEAVGALAHLESSRVQESLARYGAEGLSHPTLALLLRAMKGYEIKWPWIGRVSITALETDLLETTDEFGVFHVEPTALLLERGVHYDQVDSVLAEFPRVRNHRGRWIAWHGPVTNKAVALLAIGGQPSTAESLIAEIGEGNSLASVRDRLRNDARVCRVDRTRFGLRSWGSDEYSGIVPEIIERITRDGGATKLSKLAEELPAKFGVAESSVRAYAFAPMFVVENDMVRLREESERREVKARLDRSPMTYRWGNNLVMTVLVDSDVLRGSGQVLATGIGAALGVQPGDDVSFMSQVQEVRVKWPLSSQQPALGSIKDTAVALDAEPNELLRLRFHTVDKTCDCELLGPPGTLTEAGSPLVSAAALTGLPIANDLDLAAVLMDTFGESGWAAVSTLSKRGDHSLARAAELLLQLDVDPTTDGQPAAIDDLLNMLTN